MPFTPIQSRPLDLSIPKSPAQLERERNVAAIQDSMRRQREAEAQAKENRWLPDPLPRGIALTPDQGAYGIMRIRAGFSPYDDTPVDPVTGYPLADAPGTPRLLNTNVNFTQPAQGSTTQSATQQTASTSTVTRAATNSETWLNDVSATHNVLAYQAPQSSPPPLAVVAPPSMTVPTGLRPGEVLTWLKQNPGIRPPVELLSSMVLTKNDRATVHAQGDQAVQKGMEIGPDMRELRELVAYLEQTFPYADQQQRVGIDTNPAAALWNGLRSTYDAMADVKMRLGAHHGDDKYHHALANIAGYRSNPYGEFNAQIISDANELKDRMRRDHQTLIENDQIANRWGRQMARMYPEVQAEILVNPFLMPSMVKK